MGKMSVVIPSYNEEKMIKKTTEKIRSILEENHIPYELVFVDDGSTDNTWKEIVKASCRNVHVRGVSFSRNFGKEAAIYAGLVEGRGDCFAVIDCDLQHPAETLVEMYERWAEGYEVIEGVKEDRGRTSLFHRLCVGVFYRIISRIMSLEMSRASDFKVLDRRVVNVLLDMPEKNTFFRALSGWVGFKCISVGYCVNERSEGDSKWSTWGLIKYAMSNISSFSAAPMQVVSLLGVGFFIVAIILGVQSLFYWLTGRALEGFTTVIIIQLLVGSIVMISLGIIGYYISKIYIEVKGRPRYIIANSCGGVSDE